MYYIALSPPWSVTFRRPCDFLTCHVFEKKTKFTWLLSNVNPIDTRAVGRFENPKGQVHSNVTGIICHCALQDLYIMTLGRGVWEISKHDSHILCICNFVTSENKTEPLFFSFFFQSKIFCKNFSQRDALCIHSVAWPHWWCFADLDHSQCARMDLNKRFSPKETINVKGCKRKKANDYHRVVVVVDG